MTDDDRPQWWAESAAIKADLGLPAYDPPRFRDDTYVHEIVDPLEAEHDCAIRFGAINPQYPDDWMVWIDGEAAFTIGRHRNADGNTIYEMTADEFRGAVRDALAST
jgi:hypothetical protein